jgi:glutaredoxin-related protein
VITNLFLAATIGYCALIYFLYQRYLKRAQVVYEAALVQMSKTKLKRFINSDEISPLSKRFANEHYRKRFLKMDLNA